MQRTPLGLYPLAEFTQVPVEAGKLANSVATAARNINVKLILGC